MNPSLSLLLLVALLGAHMDVSAQVAARPVTGAKGMVVGPEQLAVDAGIEILEAGGNAIDASVAVGFALAVTWPSAGNLGGGGFMVLHGPEGKDWALDYREMAPAGASRNMYLDEDGKAVPARSQEGWLACGVPGSVAGLCHAQKSFGELPLARVMAPAIRLAEEGFLVSRFLRASIGRSAKRLARYDESRRIFLRDGSAPEEGSRLQQKDLAATLRRIAERGAEGFYQGATADLIVKEMQRGGGLITLADLENYVIKTRDPIVGEYRGHQIVGMPPPSSGCVALVQMLNLLEPYPLEGWGFGSERAVHTMVEAMRLAFRDRAQYLGDPDFSKIPTKALVSSSYADRLRPLIKDHASSSRGLDTVNPEKEQTTHYSVMDGNGWAVACTTTLNGSYGCAVTVKGAGFLLNNEMDDFAAAPGVPNMFDLIQGEANAVGPGKRPLSSMTPTLVKKDGKVMMVIGSPGGPTIINTVLECIVNVIDHGMNIAQAVAAPRFHHQWLPDEIRFEPYGLNPDVQRGLAARGHRLRERGGSQGDAHGILVDRNTGLLTGAADPRGGGAARGR